MRNPSPTPDPTRSSWCRAARDALARLSPDRRDALTEGFLRVGRELLASAEQVSVDPAWSRRTWPRRRYPQQCYPRTTKYVLDHADIAGMRLVHGVASHAPHFVPLDHAWVAAARQRRLRRRRAGVLHPLELLRGHGRGGPGYLLGRGRPATWSRLHGHPGPWNASWVPTAAQLQAYAAIVAAGRRASARDSAAGTLLATSARTDSRGPARWR